MKEAKLANEGLFTVTVLGGILSVIVLLFSIPLVPLLVKLTPNAAELTRWMMIIFAPTLFAKSCNAFLFATLNTGGKSRITFRLDLIITVSVVMPIGIIAGLVLHAPVLLVFFLIYADELIKVPFAYRQYRKYAWLRGLTNRNPNEIPTN